LDKWKVRGIRLMTAAAVLLGAAAVLPAAGLRAERESGALFLFVLTSLLLTAGGALAGAAGVVLIIQRHRSGPCGRFSAGLWGCASLFVGAAVSAALYFSSSSAWPRPTQCAVSLALIFLAGGYLSACQKEERRPESTPAPDRTDAVLNCLQPHFLFNALNVIQYLCEENPQQAERAVLDFAGFLRGNLRFLQSGAPVPFERELEHLRCYLSLEHMRYGERIRVCWEIHATAFALPPLTLQPLVENTVRFGIVKRPEGGTVCIRTAEMEEAFRVEIEDDGCGYDPREELDRGRAHMDVLAAERRLREQCGGSLSINCRPGEGTRVTMILPKKDGGDMSSDCGQWTPDTQKIAGQGEEPKDPAGSRRADADPADARHSPEAGTVYAIGGENKNQRRERAFRQTGPCAG
jgi:hypothetical protein